LAVSSWKARCFWLNLHTFLYVLGRDRLGAADHTREAVAGAPTDQAAGLEKLSASDRRAWEDAVSTYAAGLSNLDAVFDAEMVDVTSALSRSGGPTAPLPALPATVRSALERAAPLYRRIWWPAHQKANETWVGAMRPLVDRHGPSILTFITRAYAARWPEHGHPINVAAYSNWAGAYSTRGNAPGGRRLTRSTSRRITRWESGATEPSPHCALPYWFRAFTGKGRCGSAARPSGGWQ